MAAMMRNPAGRYFRIARSETLVDVQDIQTTAGLKLQQAAESISAASAKLDSSTGQEVPSLQAALSLADAVDALQQGLAAEAFAALLSLRQQAGNALVPELSLAEA